MYLHTCIKFNVHTHPCSAPEPSTKDASIFKKDLEKAIYADPLTQLDKPQKELIWKFRTYCSTIPEALPKLLRCVDWADLEQVCEVHRLLDVWRPITLDVALELLDYHFADEKVRSLAVRRLEKLANNELQNFLLQLVQVGALHTCKININPFQVDLWISWLFAIKVKTTIHWPMCLYP